MCVCVCVCACARACVCVWVCVYNCRAKNSSESILNFQHMAFSYEFFTIKSVLYASK